MRWIENEVTGTAMLLVRGEDDRQFHQVAEVPFRKESVALEMMTLLNDTIRRSTAEGKTDWKAVHQNFQSLVNIRLATEKVEGWPSNAEVKPSA